MAQDLIPYSVDQMVDSLASPVLGRGGGAIGQAIRALNATAEALSGASRVSGHRVGLRRRRGTGGGAGSGGASFAGVSGKRKRKTKTKTKGKKKKGKKASSAKALKKKKSKKLTKPGPVNLYYKHGSVETIQSRMQNTNQFEYVGKTDRHSTKVDFGHHSTPLLSLMHGVCRCFVSMLVQRAGSCVLRWDDLVKNHFIADANHAISFGFTRRPGKTPENVEILLNVANENLNSLAYRWYLAMLAIFDDEMTAEPHILYIDYLKLTAGLPEYSIGKMNLTNAYIDLRTHSKMRMQNRTPASVDTETETTNVASNPLVFHSFDVGGNSFHWKALGQQEQTVATSALDYSANAATGYCAKIVNDLTINAVPPRKADLRYCTGSKKVTVKPGDFLESHVKYNKVMTLDKFFDHLWPWLKVAQSTGGNYQVRVPVGVSRGFVVDKYLDSGNETSNIKVGVELTAKIMCRIFTRKAHVKGLFYNRSTISDPNDQGLQLVAP